MENQPTPQLPVRVSLPTETVNEILSVFSQMPYREVANIIKKVQEEVQPVPEEKSPIQVTPETPDPKVIQMDTNVPKD